MKRTQEDLEHEYLAYPPDYPIVENEAHSTYDTFLKLRDTIIYSSKVYAENAGRSLIIGVKTDGNPTGTIEIRTPNLFKVKMEPGYESNPSLYEQTSLGNYIKPYGGTGCVIQKDGRYRITHKEQIIDLTKEDPEDPSSTIPITRVRGYILERDFNTGTEIPRAVFDWEWDTSTGIKRLTSQGYIECDLEKGKHLDFFLVDQDGDNIPSSKWQQYSNWWSIEYIDLIYNSI